MLMYATIPTKFHQTLSLHLKFDGKVSLPVQEKTISQSVFSCRCTRRLFFASI